MDISIMKDYPSINYFLEYKGLSLESSDIKHIKHVLLSPEWVIDYHPSKEFVDFNIVHLYVLTYLVFRENVVNPRLIKTPRIIARILLILGNGNTDLLILFFGMLSHYHDLIKSDSDVMTSKFEIVTKLLNDPGFYYELLEKSKFHFISNPQLQLMYSVLNEKLIPFIESEKQKYGTVPHLYQKNSLNYGLFFPPPPPPPPHPSSQMFLQESHRQREPKSKPPISVMLGNMKISEPQPIYNEIKDLPVRPQQRRSTRNRGLQTTPEEMAAAAARAERAWETTERLATEAAERRKKAQETKQSGGNYTHFKSELDYGIIYLQNLLGKDLVYTEEELKDENIVILAEADSLFFITFYEKFYEIITSELKKQQILRNRVSVKSSSPSKKTVLNIGRRGLKVSVGGSHKKKQFRKNNQTRKNKKTRKN
jgi:hypothetical protein